MQLYYSAEVEAALKKGKPVLALESTIITHGLPQDENLRLAREVEEMVRVAGVVPATIAVLEGCLKVGLNSTELELFAEKGKACHKFSSYDLPIAAGLKLTGSTTVAGTIFIAHKAGLKVFATGGIGGVHKASSARMDISHDLKALSETPMVVVSSGAKCILDLESTLEHLETLGVNLVGWQTDDFPAFYYQKSKLKVPYRVENAKEVARITCNLQQSALLVVNPVPKEHELSQKYINEIMEEAHKKAREKKISGKQITPFLLSQLCEKSQGKTLTTNCALIKNNVTLACQLIKEINKYS